VILDDWEGWALTKEHARRNEAAETCFFRTTVTGHVLANHEYWFNESIRKVGIAHIIHVIRIVK
jgi:hypothetical protein